MYPTTIVLDPSKVQQQKLILLRNPTSQDIITKIYCVGPVIVERDRLVLKANERVEIRAMFTVLDGAPTAEVLVYARAAHRGNLTQLKIWLDVPLDKEKRLYRAFKLDCLPQEKVFSSTTVVLDLPGNALFHGITSHMAEGEEDDVATAENGVPLIRSHSQSRVKQEKAPSVREVKEEQPGKPDETCTFFRNLMDVFYPPEPEKTTSAAPAAGK